MARDPIRGSPDPNEVFRKSAAALAEAFRGLADERRDDRDAMIDRAVLHLG